MSGRAARLQVAAGIGYSFFLSAVTLIMELITDVFYPVRLILSPLWAIYVGQWVDAGVILAVYVLLIVFASPYRFQEQSNYYQLLRGAQKLSIYTIMAFAVISMAFDAYAGSLRARIGIFILVNFFSGMVGGILSTRAQ
ncbi:MAG: hypothetical protein RXO22_07075 [Thermocladium sp.]|jgi:hypothetical protein|nr:MAG: hypothetical protein AT710_03780 [Thermocladium sp. ECH_B]